MKIYLDDDSTNPVIAQGLRKDGHEVVIPADVGLSGKKDGEHFMHAIQTGQVLLTHNHDDFEILHKLVLLVRGHHPGVLTARRDNDRRRDMKPQVVVKAVRRLAAAQLPLADELFVLNHWR